MAARIDKDLRLPTDYRRLLTQVELCPIRSGFGTYVPRGGSRCWACDGQGIVWGEDTRVLFVALHHRRIGIFDHIWPKHEVMPPCQPWIGGMTLITSACRQEICQLRGFSAHLRREQGYGRCFQYLPWDRDALNPERFVFLYDALEGFWWPPRCQRCEERVGREGSRSTTPTSVVFAELSSNFSGRISRATSTDPQTYSVATQTSFLPRTVIQPAVSLTSLIMKQRVKPGMLSVMTQTQSLSLVDVGVGEANVAAFLPVDEREELQRAYQQEYLRAERKCEDVQLVLGRLHEEQGKVTGLEQQIQRLQNEKLVLERKIEELSQCKETPEKQEDLAEVRELVRRLFEVVGGPKVQEETEENI